ncbi:hypothetical protein [Pseudolabrys sp. FHR47]|uniref:hypothetical protein n=1 Tax=Pseudolabrys sp. FHR47 TaxID=2562284 RepID=UPI0010BEFA6A|nr:hypothetical protein [Pseudolabrys sp. FHR47]
MRFSCTAVAVLVLCQPALAVTEAEITQRCSITDPATGKQYIPEKNEWALARLLSDSVLAENTKGCRPEMTDKERLDYKNKLEFEASLKLRDIQRIKQQTKGHTTTPNVATNDIDSGFEIKTQDGTPPLIVRDARSVLSVQQLLTAKKSADGASFSYTRDIENDNQITALSGAVYLYKDIFPQPKDAGITGPFDRVTWAPGIEFDQQRNRSNPNKNVDYLSPRMVAEFALPGETVRQLFRIAGYYNTDSRGQTKVWGGSLEWQPVSNVHHISSGFRISPSLPLGFRFDPIAHFEVEKVAAAGPLTNISDGDHYFRAGPILQASFWFLDGPEPLRRLTFGGQFRQLWGNAGSGMQKDLRYWQANLAYNLDEAGHAAIKATYRQGDLPGIGQDVRDFKTGLSIKY